MALYEDQIFVGLALSCANRVDGSYSVPENIPSRMHEQRVALDSPIYMQEWQPEQRWVSYDRYNNSFSGNYNRWWHTLANDKWLQFELKNQPHILGIHAPNKMIDVLDISWNQFKKRESIESICEAMEFANSAGADYFVFHLVQKDIWPVDVHYRRGVIIPEALHIYAYFAEYYRRRRFTFVPCVEILEFPKFPATPFEVCQILRTCKMILPETKLAFDIAHLWRSRSLICETQKDCSEFANVKFKSFTNVLLDTLNSLGSNDIYLFHLGGCWETRTHEIPGIYPMEDAYDAEFRLDCPKWFYDENDCREMNYSEALDVIIDFCWRCNQPLRLILEIYEKDFDVLIKSLKEMNWAIHNKVRRRWGN